MVTGVYFPEVNGAAFQCMRIISALKVVTPLENSRHLGQVVSCG